LMAGETGPGASKVISATAIAANEIRWLHGVFFMVSHHLSQALP
jgi:hypothetical protein